MSGGEPSGLRKCVRCGHTSAEHVVGGVGRACLRCWSDHPDPQRAPQGAICLGFAGGDTPYACADCGRAGCKLWRTHSTFAGREHLRCADCGAASQGEDASKIRADGKRPGRVPGTWTDEIGWLVPAVPDGEGSFWDYAGAPDEGVAWWLSLPLRPYGDAEAVPP